MNAHIVLRQQKENRAKGKRGIQKSWSYHCFSGLSASYSSHKWNHCSIILLHISHCFLPWFDVPSCMCYVSI